MDILILLNIIFWVGKSVKGVQEMIVHPGKRLSVKSKWMGNIEWMKLQLLDS